MPSMDEASENVRAAREAMGRGDFGLGFKLLREGLPAAAARPATSPGDDYAGYPPMTSPGDDYPYWPYSPPSGPPQADYPPQASYNVAPGWYLDPFDGVGYRWWNGQGWTQSTNG